MSQSLDITRYPDTCYQLLTELAQAHFNGKLINPFRISFDTLKDARRWRFLWYGYCSAVRALNDDLRTGYIPIYLNDSDEPMYPDAGRLTGLVKLTIENTDVVFTPRDVDPVYVRTHDVLDALRKSLEPSPAEESSLADQ